MPEKSQTKRNIIGILGCIGGLLCHIVLGSPYQWGIINIYVASYYRLTDSSITLETSAIAFPIIMFVGSFFVTPGLTIAEKTHPSAMLAVVAVLNSACVFDSSYMSTLWTFIVFYGFLFAVVSTATYMVPLVECNKYFPDKKMVVNGFILIGSGVGSLIFGMFSFNFLNPHNIPHNKGYYNGSEQLQNIARRVPDCLRWLGLLNLAFGLSAAVLLLGVCRQNRKTQAKNKTGRDRKNKVKQNTEQALNFNADNIIVSNQKPLLQEHNKNQYGDVHDVIQPESGSQQKPPRQVITTEAADNKNIVNILSGFDNDLVKTLVPENQPANLKVAMHSCVFWMGALVLFLGVCGPHLLNVNYKTYARLAISDDQFLTVIGIVSAIGNGISRIIWNLIFTRVGYKFIIMTCLTLQIAVFSTIRFTLDYPALYLIHITLSSCCFGGFISITSAYCQIVFGNKIGARVFGFYIIMIGVGAFTQFGLVLVLTPVITLDGVIYIVLGMFVVDFFIVLLYKFQGPWKNSLGHLGYCLTENAQ